MVINFFIATTLIISPLMRASWDLWAQTIIHLITLLAILILIFKKETFLPFYLSTFLPLFIFTLFCFISIFTSFNFYESRNEFFNILNYIAIFYLVKYTDKKYIIPPALISGLILAFYGFYQKIFIGGNIASFMNNPNIFAGYLVGLICLTFSSFIYRPQSPTEQMFGTEHLFGYCLLIIFVAALALTGSTASWISLNFGFLVFCYLIKKRLPKKYIYLLVGISVFLIILKLNSRDSFNRIIWWLTAGKMILSKPFTGVGLNALADAYPKYKLSGLNSVYAHNYFLQTAAEIGLFGFLAFLWFLVEIFRQTKTAENSSFFVAISAMLIHGFFDYSLLIPANAILLWAFLGICSRKEKPVPVTLTQNQTTIFKWLAVFFVSAAIYSLTKIFLGNRETAMGKYLLDQKKYNTAQLHFNKALQYDRNNPQTYLYLSNVYQEYFKLTKYYTYLDEAEIELNKAAKLQKKNYENIRNK
ncbi:MAG: O-antigen ligase family protein [Elusimicrobiota bacterium]